ncbi:MAG: outer membrane porin, OprD family [Pseudomonas sp.]|uniref:OprD family porin n=1 Tax=Pseudomonas sp. 9Ag TaxID=2653167 RepID=UPI000C3F9575|nr:OprD family porin [Pseudomonas sp. 9Ag]MAX91252.1 outer membrane porin, OprD family [Pseudomonas sp.]MBK58657.1 outer membrane porin, OprD family [Pseudomonas sp.]VXC66742.1 Porin-like protein NicP [Pseudomonas sp. 9Ag]HBS81298.1 outer membrane porin, OprD family [Pseudomonas sp.]|tara:strand:- start:19783 stop:21027 length:1245 start_codon:yes stop_codon:yes gene_type:complete
MLKTPIARGVALATLGATLAIPTMAQAAFVEDAKAGLELRNFYMNSDNRSVPSSSQSKSEEWAQGFLLRAESGYTEGTVGFGVDALGLLGVKLDSGRGRTGTGLLPTDNDGSAPNEYSELGLTAKAKISNSILKVGTLEPKNMAVARSDSRLLPQTFKGGQLVSNEIKGLTLDLGYLTEVNERNDSHYDDLKAQLRGGTTANEIDNFIFAGASYKLLDNLTGSYYYSNLEEAYKQHSFNVVHVQPLGEGQSLKTDLRYARSSDDGSSTVDNKALGGMVTYSVSGHSFGLAYQEMRGDTGFAYLDGTDPFLVNYVMIAADFAKADEESWQARYDYNFAAIGIPGLTFMTRYVTGDDFGAGGNGKEWERDTDIAYVFQDGALKNLGVKWRNGTYRSNSNRDIDQNRLIVSYTIPLM